MSRRDVVDPDEYPDAAGVDPSSQEVTHYQEMVEEPHSGGERGGPSGVAPDRLDDEALLRELESLHRTRNTTLRHGSDDALDAHTRRTQVLEAEYLRRRPEREVDPDRLR